MRRITWLAIVCWLSATLSVSPLLAHGGGGHGGGGHGGGGHMGGGHMGGSHFGGGHYGGGAVHTYHGGGGFYSNPSGHMNTMPMHNGAIYHNAGQGIQGTRAPVHSGITQHSFNSNRATVGQHTVHMAHAGYQPAYYRHGQFYHGYWHNARYAGGGWGGYGWGFGYGLGFGLGYYPYFWGLGGWGLGSLMYTSGYCGYYNPYYNSGYGGYNYGQPIPVYYNQANNQNNQNSVHPADMILNSAIGSFRQNDFVGALDLANQGIAQYPDDAVLHEFRSLVLFAKGDYAQSAATIHSVLAVGPGWDWTTMNSIYSNVGIYTAQLRNLEGFVTQNPDNGSAHFLLGYHYMTCGFPESATKQFAKVVELVPSDQVAAALLRMTSAQQSAPASGSNANLPNPTPQPPTTDGVPNKTTGPAVDPSTLVGDWKSSRADDSTFALRLGGDKTFTWTFTPKGQPAVSFSGTYTLDGNVIALERTGGGSLVAQITSNDGSKFNFKMVGAPAEDPGLNFAK